jgi:transcriptional regulator with XRE-family HTH domain
MMQIAQIEQNEAVELLDGRLCAAARALLGWTQETLSAEGKLARRTISDFEKGGRRPHRRIVREIVETFYGNGIVLIRSNSNEIGLMLRPET